MPISLYGAMTNSEPPSSPDYDPYELFKDELDLDFDLDLETESEQPPIDVPSASPYAAQDEDRLYTDEIIRQNEMASRFLFVSMIVAGVISAGVGLWYLAVRKPTPPPQSAPLQVPEQPPIAPLPSLPPNFPSNGSVIPSPAMPNQTPPINSGAVPGGVAPKVPTTASPNVSGTTPPPPPPTLSPSSP
jgi:hypothetical protein